MFVWCVCARTFKVGTSFNFDAQWIPNIFSFVLFAIFIRHILQRVLKIVVVHLFVLRRHHASNAGTVCKTPASVAHTRACAR